MDQQEFDYTRAEIDVLINLIRRDNGGRVLTKNMVEFGFPSVNTPVPGYERNTQIMASSTDETRYTGGQMFYYDRVGLIDFVRPGVTNTEFVLAGETRTSQLVGRINERLSINLNIESILDEDLPTLSTENPTAEVFIKAAPTSLVYIGQLGIRIKTA